jgi:hypothetical protein
MRRLTPVLLAIVGLAGACTSAGEQDATRDEAGAITDTDEVGVFRLREGDCLALPGADLGDDQVESLEAVPCTEPHGGEVLALIDVEGGEDAPFPGREVMDETATERCVAEFDSTTGTDFMSDPDWNMTWLTPTDDSWTVLGDREIVCIVVPLDGTPTTDLVTG